MEQVVQDVTKQRELNTGFRMALPLRLLVIINPSGLPRVNVNIALRGGEIVEWLTTGEVRTL